MRLSDFRRYNALRILAVAGALILVGCAGPASEEASSGGSERVQRTPSSSGAVIPKSAARKLLRQCSRSTPWAVDTWSPPTSVIAELEARLPAYIDSVSVSFPELRLGVQEGRYYMQYVGIVHWNGKRSVYINAFDNRYLEGLSSARRRIAEQEGQASADTVMWRTAPIAACDGGQMFFGLEYDPNRRRFRRFRVDGAAAGQ